MDPLSVSASIVALLQLSSTVINYLSDVKGGPKELQRIRLEISSILSLLITLQDQADQPTAGDACSSTLRSLNVPNGPFQQFHSALERLASKLAPVEGWKMIGKAFKWPFEKEEMSDIINTIERLKSLLSLARQNDHIALSKATKIELEAMNAEVNEISTGVSKLQTGPMYNDIRRWLSAPDPSSNYNRALKDRHATTGDWFLKSKAYQHWLSKMYSLLWLHGIPGCGKTVLSSATIQNTFEYCESRTNSVVLYFYFDFNDFQKQRHGQMVRSLVSQLLSYDHTVPSKLSELYSSCMNGERQPSLDNLLATLHRMMTAFGRAYVVLDALDECEDVSEALTTIETIRSWTDVKCSILVMSRREKDIEDGLMSSSGAAETVCVQSALVDADIRRYVSERLRTDRRLRRWQKEQFEIEDALVRQANGMFRWAACQLDALCNCRSVHQLRKALSSLPETLDRTYDQILGKVKAEDYQFAAKFLRWLTYSVRPLRLEEIAEVIAIDSNSDPHFDLGKRFEDPSDILEICSSLVSVEDVEIQRHHQNKVDIDTDANEDADSYYDSWSDTGRYRKAEIRLAHFSVKEYLVSDRIQHGPAFAYSLKEEFSNESIAADCLAYLLHLIEPDNCRSELTIVEYPLARYAARYWIDHIHFVKSPKSTALTLVQELFLEKEEVFVNWIQLWDPDRPLWSTSTMLSMSTGPPLYYASLLGFLESVEKLVDKGADVNVQAGVYGNALIAASASGHIEIVQLLVEKGATINSNGDVYGTTALVAASFEGHIEIVQLLVQKGADIDAQGRSDVGVALDAASTAGHTEILRFLLDRTAHSEAPWVQSALEKACSNGDEGTVRVLLGRGAIVDLKSLLAALREERERVVRILIEHGCHLVQTDMEGRSVCHYACIIGDLKAVEMLIRHGTDLTVLDQQGRNCLHFAASSRNPGSPDLVAMLLKHGFDPNSLDYNDWTPLHWAAKGGVVKNIKILEDAGAKFSNENIGGRTPGDVAVFHNRDVTWHFNTATNSYLERGVQHKAICDGCDQSIYGSRYRCMDCTDFDYCFKCKQSSNLTHPEHKFIFNPTKFQRQFLPFCSGCFMNIHGSRYKCLDYQRMDYCLDCRPKIETSHPGHNSIKDPTPAQLREFWGAYAEADALEKHIADASKGISEPPAWG